MLTIVSYINFENRYDIQENIRNVDDEFENSIVFFETNQNVSSIAFKTLMEILGIWELYPVSKRPSLSSYLTYDNNAFSYVDEIVKKSFDNPETANCFLEFLVMCMNSQTAFINILFKNERIFDNIIGIFCKNVEFTIGQARNHRSIKRLVGMLFILVSNLIQNSKIKFSNSVKEMIREFLTAYISNSNDTVQKLFINRDSYKKEHFEMTIIGFGFKKEEEQLNPDLREIILEQSVKDICFYNHVLAAYILIVAHLLISIDKDPENKKQALKCLSFMFKGQIFEILELWTIKRLTDTGEVLSELTNMLYKLEDDSYINYREGESNGVFKPSFKVSDIEEIKITYQQLLTNTTQDATTDDLKLVKSSNQSKFRNNIYGYGRSFAIDRNEFYYILKNCFYNSKFIDETIRMIGKYNLEMSLIDSERTLMKSVHDIFAFISSLGHDGYLGSSFDKVSRVGTFSNNLKKTINDVNYGFSFFTIVGLTSSKIKKEEFMNWRVRLLGLVIEHSKIIWNSIKADLDKFNPWYLDFNSVISKSFGQKLNFLKSIFHSKIYLKNLDYSDVEMFTGGSEYLSSKEIEEEKIDLEKEEAISSSITNISIDIIKKLSEILYTRTKLNSDFPSEDILLDVIFEFIPVFLNSVIQDEVWLDENELIINDVISLAKEMRHFLDYKDGKYYNSIVLLYEQLIKVLDDKNEISSLFRMKDSMVIKRMMLKITQKDWTEAQYLSTIKFMIAYSSPLQDGAKHLMEERITTALISAYCLQNLEEQDYYENKERNSKHILWLWTLHLMRQLASILINNSEFAYPLIGFITAFEDRIMRVLQFKGYIDGKKQFKVFSLARLEEIEHIINLVSFILMNYTQWKLTKGDQLERIINILFSFSVNLFQSNVALSDCYHPNSQYEIWIHNLFGDESSGNIRGESTVLLTSEKKPSGGYSNISQSDKSAMINKVVTSLRTPLKGETSASDFSILEYDEYSGRAYKASSLGSFMVDKYRPSGFILKVELSLSKILLMLLRSMQLIIKCEMKQGSRSDFIKELNFKLLLRSI